MFTNLWNFIRRYVFAPLSFAPCIASQGILCVKLALIRESWLRLKRVSQAVLAAQMLDVTTTLGGLYLLPQLWEMNPLLNLLGGWAPTLVFKFLATLVIVFVLEMVESWPVLVKIVPLTAILPGVWNLFTIVIEYFA